MPALAPAPAPANAGPSPGPSPGPGQRWASPKDPLVPQPTAQAKEDPDQTRGARLALVLFLLSSRFEVLVE